MCLAKVADNLFLHCCSVYPCFQKYYTQKCKFVSNAQFVPEAINLLK